MEIAQNRDLSRYNSFGLPVRTAHFYALRDATELPELCQTAAYQAGPVLWLGGGSNVLLTADYPGLVVHMATRGITFTEVDADTVWVEAQAGEVWHDFVQYTLAHGACGLENLSLIPGTVGAAPVQNIGAYGVEVKDRIRQVQCFDLHTRQWCSLTAADCRFAYRDSLFKQQGGRYVIVSVQFALSRRFEPVLRYGDVAQMAQTHSPDGVLTAQAVAQAVCRIRASKLPDPQVLGNVGSFFKNPLVDAVQAAALLRQHPDMPHYPQADGQVKLAAGWLIDQAGLKGRRVGGAAVHAQQALVLVNQDQATAADVLALAAQIQAEIQEKFGVALVPEPVFVP